MVHRDRDRGPSADPVEDLRRGWDGYVESGLRIPAIYGLMHGGRTKPTRRRPRLGGSCTGS
ncbi:hypothetical protein ACSHWB_42800 [Lentzea sp. HUAS TT2]|uniref:hypothetical protein n=1 Tax=Lentzea sp. HUAS TT2 TaxID=3447454 RepID=UPI003F702272